MRASKNLSDIFLRVMAALDSMVKPGAYPQNEVLRLSSRFEAGTSRTRAPGRDVSPVRLSSEELINNDPKTGKAAAPILTGRMRAGVWR
jgi:hypothetical protein